VLAIDAQLKMAQHELARLGSVLPEVELPTLDACVLDACDTNLSQTHKSEQSDQQNT
jgi:hypothetical protein